MTTLIQTPGKYCLSAVNGGPQIALYLCILFLSAISHAFTFFLHEITFEVKFTHNVYNTFSVTGQIYFWLTTYSTH